MITKIKNNRKKYVEKIVSSLDEFSYRKARYSLNFSLAVGLVNEEISLENFIDLKRKTDDYIHLENNLYCIVLDGADYDAAIKATSNLQTQFQSNYFDKKLFIAVISSDECDNDKTMVNQLFDILEYSVSHKMDGMVIDKYQMLRHNH